MNLNAYQSEDLLLLLKKGSAVVFPTDTLPAVATLPSNVKSLWRIKKRPITKPFILMGASKEQLLKFVLPEAKEDALKMSSYWPGALTIVVPSSKTIVEDLNPFGQSIGMRVPACDMAIQFLQKSGPLATSSANLSGEKPSSDPIVISQYFPDLPLLDPSSWPKPSGIASTLIEWEGLGSWKILRLGSLIPDEIAQE